MRDAVLAYASKRRAERASQDKVAAELGMSPQALCYWRALARHAPVAIVAKREPTREVVGRNGLRELASIVTPEAILRWYRELIARKYDGTAKRKPGRPRKAEAIAELVQRMARENPRWGYTRIVGAMKNLGHEVGRNTVKRMLADAGIDPRLTGVAECRGRRSCARIGKLSPPRTSSRSSC